MQPVGRGSLDCAFWANASATQDLADRDANTKWQCPAPLTATAGEYVPSASASVIQGFLARPATLVPSARWVAMETVCAIAANATAILVSRAKPARATLA